MEWIDDVEAFQRRAAQKEGKQLVEEMRKTVGDFMEHFQDDPEVESGWGHAYFCSECGSFLEINPRDPHHHRCPHCGKIMEGPEYDGAWVYLYRYDAVMSALGAAVLYRITREEEYLAYFQRVVGFYAENWYRFCEHGRHTWPSGNGKITPQALNEAIFLVKICTGLALLMEDLPTQFLEQVKAWFLLPCAYFLDVQKRRIHNIPCWINAAVGTAGLMTGQDDLIQRAFSRPFGLSDQVRGGGVTASGFWYEGSIHYHFFTLEAFMNTLLFARFYGQEIPQDVTERIYGMLIAPCQYAFSNGELPNPNDGWPNLNLKTYSFIYEMGARIFREDAEKGRHLAALSAKIRQLSIQRVAVPLSYPTYAGDVSLEWLLYAQEAEKTEMEKIPYFQRSYVFEASQFATLKTKNVEVFYKFGHCTASHAHPDKMNVEIRAFGQRVSHDLSNCGYAAKLCAEFHRTSVSHNTVVMDGKNHPTTDPGQLLSFDGKEISARAPEAYPGIHFVRQLQLENDILRDTFRIENPQKQWHTWDFFLHLDGRILDMPETEPGELGYRENGYAYLHNPRKMCTKEELCLHWEFAGGVEGEQRLILRDKELWICESPDNPPSKEKNRVSLLIRSREAEPVFEQTWKFIQKGLET